MPTIQQQNTTTRFHYICVFVELHSVHWMLVAAECRALQCALLPGLLLLLAPRVQSTMQYELSRRTAHCGFYSSKNRSVALSGREELYQSSGSSNTIANCIPRGSKALCICSSCFLCIGFETVCYSSPGIRQSKDSKFAHQFKGEMSTSLVYS